MTDNSTTVTDSAITNSTVTNSTVMATPATYKCLLVGDAGVRVFVKRHVTGQFDKKYQATLGVNVQPADFFTSHGIVTFNVWDCGNLSYSHWPGKFHHDYWADADCAIVMYDCSSKISREGWS